MKKLFDKGKINMSKWYIWGKFSFFSKRRLIKVGHQFSVWGRICIRGVQGSTASRVANHDKRTETPKNGNGTLTYGNFPGITLKCHSNANGHKFKWSAAPPAPTPLERKSWLFGRCDITGKGNPRAVPFLLKYFVSKWQARRDCDRTWGRKSACKEARSKE